MTQVLFFSLLLAEPFYLKELPERAKRCDICHLARGGRGDLNFYGRDFAQTGSVASIDTWDSDGDGYKNNAELKYGTNPGDPQNFPRKKRYSLWFLGFLVVVLILLGGILLKLKKLPNKKKKLS